jgi:purine-nucleoside phosphorylase
MTIYLDVLLLSTLWADYALLRTTAALTHTPLKALRCLLAAAAGAASAMSIFLPPLPLPAVLLLRILLAVLLCGIGSTIAGNDVIGLNWEIGATQFILFGSAGNLNREATTGKYVIPTEAYRDEGMSYHYAPPADYIAIKNADKLAAMFDELRLPYVKGRVWTTDAFYRETRDLVAARQKEGCLAVEMELAGVEAVCDFYGFELYNFLVTGDVLDAPVYENGELRSANHDPDKLDIALEIAKRI